MEKKTFEDFAMMLYPQLRDQFELYNMSDEELIGQKVISIRAGFSGEAGTKCYISSIQPPYKITQESPDLDRINFLGRDGFEKGNKLGWQVRRKHLVTSVKLDRS